MRSRSGGVWPMEACGRCRPVDGWPSTGLGHRRAMPPPPTGPATARDWLKESIDDVTTRSRGVSRFRFPTTVRREGSRFPSPGVIKTGVEPISVRLHAHKGVQMVASSSTAFLSSITPSGSPLTNSTPKLLLSSEADERPCSSSPSGPVPCGGPACSGMPSARQNVLIR